MLQSYKIIMVTIQGYKGIVFSLSSQHNHVIMITIFSKVICYQFFPLHTSHSGLSYNRRSQFLKVDNQNENLICGNNPFTFKTFILERFSKFCGLKRYKKGFGLKKVKVPTFFVFFVITFLGAFCH
jgi:hypothetical protein